VKRLAYDYRQGYWPSASQAGSPALANLRVFMQGMFHPALLEALLPRVAATEHKKLELGVAAATMSQPEFGRWLDKATILVGNLEISFSKVTDKN
jgi:hypothetical protein